MASGDKYLLPKLGQFRIAAILWHILFFFVAIKFTDIHPPSSTQLDWEERARERGRERRSGTIRSINTRQFSSNEKMISDEYVSRMNWMKVYWSLLCLCLRVVVCVRSPFLWQLIEQINDQFERQTTLAHHQCHQWTIVGSFEREDTHMHASSFKQFVLPHTTYG